MYGENGEPCALVLSGGSIKGAFQVGAIRAILDRGWQPSAVYGISVGALNGAFVVDRAGRHLKESELIDWPQIGADLVEFWSDNIRSLADIGKKRSTVSLLWKIIRSKFNGLIDTTALQEIVKREIDPTNLQRARIIYTAGFVDMNRGVLATGQPGDVNILDEIIASTAIPIIMPPSLLTAGNRTVVATDGGVRDVAPFSRAINDNANTIIAVLTQPERMQSTTFKYGNLLHFSQRVMDIIVNETVNNDLKLAERVNQLVQMKVAIPPEHPYHSARNVTITPIRPEEELDIELDSFSSDDIRRVIEIGHEVAVRELDA